MTTHEISNLSIKEWKPFKINDLFEVDKGIYLNEKNVLKGDNPYISAKSINNGLNYFIGNKTLFLKNTITIEKIKLSAFYQPTDYYCSHDVSVLKSKILNKNNSLFISSMINRQGSKYSYGRQAQMNVVKRETVYLPINKKEEPDYKYMEEYTNNLTTLMQKKYITYIEQCVKKLTYKTIVKLEKKEWQEFFLTDIFTEIQRGKRLTKANQMKGDKPYVSSTGQNNGIDNYIGNENKVRVFDNCLSIANSGSVGASFYHSYEFVASDHITHLKNDDFNEYIYLFISTLTNRLSGKYNFNREINDKRISREKILLPINNKEEPDYKYMEQYMINMKYKKINQYLKYLESM